MYTPNPQHKNAVSLVDGSLHGHGLGLSIEFWRTARRVAIRLAGAAQIARVTRGGVLRIRFTFQRVLFGHDQPKRITSARPRSPFGFGLQSLVKRGQQGCTGPLAISSYGRSHRFTRLSCDRHGVPHAPRNAWKKTLNVLERIRFADSRRTSRRGGLVPGFAEGALDRSHLGYRFGRM